MFKLILVSTDGTATSSHAVKAAARLAGDLGSTLLIFHASRTYEALYFPDGVGMAWPPYRRNTRKRRRLVRIRY